eukprot:353404-Chlamydomonas_euryale.AAC.20
MEARIGIPSGTHAHGLPEAKDCPCVLKQVVTTRPGHCRCSTQCAANLQCAFCATHRMCESLHGMVGTKPEQTVACAVACQNQTVKEKSVSKSRELIHGMR